MTPPQNIRLLNLAMRAEQFPRLLVTGRSVRCDLGGQIKIEPRPSGQILHSASHTEYRPHLRWTGDSELDDEIDAFVKQRYRSWERVTFTVTSEPVK